MNEPNYSNILVPVDLSEASLNALETAAAIARKHGAKITILYIQDDSFDFVPGEKHGTLTENSNEVVSALANTIYGKLNIKPEVIKQSGAAAPLVVKTALDKHSDLIVIGTHGASGYRDGFVGTNTYSVAKYAHCPVLMVPPHKKWNQFRKVLFPIRPVVGALMRYDVIRNFLSADSQLNILSLSYGRMAREQNSLEEITTEISSRIRQDKVIAKTSWGNGNGIAEDVLAYSLQQEPDMIVVTSSLDVTNKTHFIGPNAQKIISHARVPVLSIKKVAAAVGVSS